ncbi:hypothetical protein QAD02_021062 [Eretmocerus hayati]|uniref:Uncharacterized protein n=1 Tax=Eretmocerus hayati TaxID=131215 RepID=A0ACC2PNU6_9HYME|nr:hypothetical protein QAD02_021062 [Eretmocerus hayati]
MLPMSITSIETIHECTHEPYLFVEEINMKPFTQKFLGSLNRLSPNCHEFVDLTAEDVPVTDSSDVPDNLSNLDPIKNELKISDLKRKIQNIDFSKLSLEDKPTVEPFITKYPGVFKKSKKMEVN